MKELYQLIFEIDGLPKMTNPSGAKSTHWRVVKKERDAWKLAVHSIVATRHRPSAPLQKAILVLTRFSSVAPDPDGLVSGFKAIVDGLVSSGILANDKFTNIGMPSYHWMYAPPKEGKIRVEVREGITYDQGSSLCRS